MRTSTGSLVLASLWAGQTVGFEYGGISGEYRDACPDYQQFSKFKHAPYGDGPMALPYQRPAKPCRTFQSDLVEKIIKDMNSSLVDRDLARLFENAFPNTLDTTVKWHADVSHKAANNDYQHMLDFVSSDAWKGPQSFIVTGDITAMWLR
jgi:hypothetical protein